MHPVLFQLGSFVVPSYGAAAAVGVLLALWLAQFTARRAGLDPRHAWNILVLAVFSALVASRLLLIGLNLSDLRKHPRWLLTVAMIHHPLLAGAGVAGALVAFAIYIRWARLPLLKASDVLAAPISVGIAAEQMGALLAGSGFGTDCTRAWAITYTSGFAARWSGTPLGVPLHPVQAYAAVGSLTVAALTLVLLSPPKGDAARRTGDATGVWLIANGILLFVTEIFRDWEGRGVLLRGSVDAPQLVALGMVLVGGLLLADWQRLIARKVTHV
jgi:phosphatidylglycerol:prolipoprotein diacylglycerol transferase